MVEGESLDWRSLSWEAWSWIHGLLRCGTLIWELLLGLISLAAVFVMDMLLRKEGQFIKIVRVVQKVVGGFRV